MDKRIETTNLYDYLESFCLTAATLFDRAKMKVLAIMNDYDTPYQTSLISMLLSDPAAWQACSTHFEAEYFDDGLKAAVRYIAKHCEQYGKMPSIELIGANTHGFPNHWITQKQRSMILKGSLDIGRWKTSC